MRKLRYEEIQQQHPTAEEVVRLQKPPVYVVVDNVRSLHNVGSIFRTADGAGIHTLFLCGITGTPPRDEIRKTSLGAEEVVRWEYNASAVEIVQKLKNQGIKIVVLEHTDESIDFKSAEYRLPLCLVIGHEHKGVSDDVVSLADLAIEIPMHGIKQSLNVSVAFGIAIYHITAHI